MHILVGKCESRGRLENVRADGIKILKIIVKKIGSMRTDINGGRL
jgi:hypothetical protein